MDEIDRIIRVGMLRKEGREEKRKGREYRGEEEGGRGVGLGLGEGRRGNGSRGSRRGRKG